jgi:group I intron endonuclease
MIIYKTTNLVNGKIYIGKDKNNNPTYLGSGKILKLAIKKYGKENFTKETLEECLTEEVWLLREKYWIKHFDSISTGYNIAEGGQGGDTISNNPNRDVIVNNHSKWMVENNPTRGRKKSGDEIEKWKKSFGDKSKGVNNPNYGKHHSEETKSKIREKALGRTVSEETRQKISRANSGKDGYWKDKENIKHSEWMKKNNPFRGKTHSEEHIQKLREVNSEPKFEEHKNNISKNSPNNKQCVIESVIYRSVAEAARQLGISENTVRGRVKNKNFKDWNYENNRD